jgi:hypothetical protein
VIILAEGAVNDEGMMEMVHLFVDLYGAKGVDMRDVALHIIATPNGGTKVSQPLIFDSNIIDPEETTYTIDEVADPLDQWDPEGTPAIFILGERSRLKININLTRSATALVPDSTLEIFIQVTTSGYQSYDYFRTPASYPVQGIVTLED